MSVEKPDCLLVDSSPNKQFEGTNYIGLNPNGPTSVRGADLAFVASTREFPIGSEVPWLS
jgi:hypothetical protein